MSDKEQRAHELALCVVSEVMSRDYETYTNSDNDGDELREVLAASVLEQYEFFYGTFLKTMK